MKNKKWLLLLIIALPSFFWLILETSTIHSYRLNYFGPKIVRGEKDTLFYSVGKINFSVYNEQRDTLDNFPLDTVPFPFYAIMFVKEEYAKDGYRLAGLNEYLQYKTDAVKHIPFFLVSMYEGRKPSLENDLKKISHYTNLHFLCLRANEHDSVNRVYFKQKPYYVDEGFFVLVDNKRHIRGYYDSRYASEIKRLSDEYKHIRLKTEKEKMIHQNEIEKHE